jgi:hypothetical protein
LKSVIKEKSKRFGEWEIKVKNIDTGITKIERVKNRLMDVALDEFMKPLYYAATLDFRIKIMAVGTSTTAVQNVDTQLGNEVFRCIPSVDPYSFGTGQVSTEFVLFSGDANVTIEEIGVFCGMFATVGSPNSGILLSRILWHHVKTSSEEITFNRLDSIIRG